MLGRLTKYFVAASVLLTLCMAQEIYAQAKAY